MRGQMMEYPLTLQQFLERNRRLFGRKEVVCRTPDGLTRTSYAAYTERVGRLANALRGLGVREGDRVGTFAWNTSRHLEFYYAVPCMGAVLHTVNIRLSAEQLVYSINDAGDTVLAVDKVLLPVIAPLRSQLKTVEQLIVLQDEPELADDYLDYEALLAAASPEVAWPALDENQAAGICYSSGTTGQPKGVVYSHRAIYLHSMSLATADSIGVRESDRALIVIPMFHANAWALPFICAGVGADMVLTGEAPRPADLLRLMQDEQVTVAAAVPTVWIGVLEELRRSGPSHALSSLRYLVCGGAPPSVSLINAYAREVGVPLTHSWGMTETTPVATMGRLKSYLRNVPKERRDQYAAKQGLPVLGIDITILDEEGNELPWDGQTHGEVAVRGPFVTAGYLHADTPDRFVNGWFRTGDVGTIDPEGYVNIVDRTKDLVKSGGEWISSVELERLIMNHPDVLEAAVIAVPDPKWGERPLPLVVLRPGAHVTEDAILDAVRPHVARYAVPDRVLFVDEIPKTGVGKFDKKVLRQRFAASDSPQDRAHSGRSEPRSL